MNKVLLLPFTGLLVMFCVSADAKSNRKLVGRAKFIATIDFDCLTSNYPRRSLQRVVRAAMKGREIGGVGVWGNKAVAFDLNKDGKPEYFVPLDCGATGNCNWGIFASKPVRRLATIPAEFVYIRQGRSTWPVLVTYIHGNAYEGLISVYRYVRRRYVNSPGNFEVKADRKDFPKSMETVPSTCERRDAVKQKGSKIESKSGAMQPPSE